MAIKTDYVQDDIYLSLDHNEENEETLISKAFFDDTDITGAEAEILTNGEDANALHIHNNKYTELSTIFESSGRFITGNTSSTVTFGANGVSFASSATADGHAFCRLNVSNFTNINLFRGDVFFSVFVDIVARTTGDNDAFFGVGNVSVSFAGHVFTDNHIGFIFEDNGGTIDIKGSVSNGTHIKTVTIASGGAGTSFEVLFKKNGTSSVDFYVRKNGGAWSIEFTISTNIPTTNTNILQVSLADKAVSTKLDFNCSSLSYRRLVS